MPDQIRVSAVIPALPQRIFDAWLDPRQHSAMTGSRATADRSGRFTAWDGYISGTTIVKEPARRIVQGWRTTEFPDGSADSRLEVLLERVGSGTRVTLVHTEIPDGQGTSYEGGWQQFYFGPMRAYFAGTAALGLKAPKGKAKKKSAKKVAAKKVAAKKATPKSKGAGKKAAKPSPKKPSPKKPVPKKTVAKKPVAKKKAAQKKATKKKPRPRK